MAPIAASDNPPVKGAAMIGAAIDAIFPNLLQNPMIVSLT
tara:strand:+ start:434 stop:553 length:120 start_codon:yes stop_codon:yes gene_type:complete